VCSHRAAAESKCPRSETHAERSPVIGYVAGADAPAHRSTALTYKGMQAPDTIPLDASIKSVAIVVSYARADEVCIALLIRNFVSFIDRNQTTYGGVPEHGYTFHPYASYACRTDAGLRN